MNRGYDINRSHYLNRFVINIRASKNISGLVKVTLTSPAGLMKFFLNVEPSVNPFMPGNLLDKCRLHLQDLQNNLGIN